MTFPDPYYSDDHVTIYHGDCLEIMGRFGARSPRLWSLSMSDYTEPRQEVPGQLGLLDPPPPKPKPHAGARAAVLQALEHAPHPVDIHDLAAVIEGQESGWIARRLGELADTGHARRVGTHRGRHGRETTLWAAT